MKSIKGKKPEEFLKHRKACAAHNITADVEVYQKSRATALLDECCAEDRGFTLGVKGKFFHDVFPKPFEYSFLKGYNRGRHLYQEEQEHYRHVLKKKTLVICLWVRLEDRKKSKLKH